MLELVYFFFIFIGPIMLIFYAIFILGGPLLYILWILLSFVYPWNGRNERGREMLSLVENLLEIIPTTSSVKSATLSCWFRQKIFFWRKKGMTLGTSFFREIGDHLSRKRSRQMIMRSWVWLFEHLRFQTGLHTNQKEKEKKRRKKVPKWFIWLWNYSYFD